MNGRQPRDQRDERAESLPGQALEMEHGFPVAAVGRVVTSEDVRRLLGED